MNGSLRIGSLFGFPILIHWTFLIVIPLFAWIIGSTVLPLTSFIQGFYSFITFNSYIIPIDTSLITDGYMPYLLGVIVALGLFVGVLIHEIAHSIVAKRNGIKISSITLLIFGGVSSMEEGAPDPKVELPMALAGPLTSLLIGIICTGLGYGATFLPTNPPVDGAFAFAFGYLGLTNILLFGFNMIPAFPMDGGRVLRAWFAMRMPLPEATRIAAAVGKAFAVIFGVIGVIGLNPILVLIAIFIYFGAGQEASASKYNFLLKDVTVGDMMSKPVVSVAPDTPVRNVIELMYATKHLGFPVVDRGVLIGIITVADVHKIHPIDRDAMQVKDVMSRQPITLPPEAPVIDALRIMSVRDIGRVPVVKDENLVGIVTRTDILKVIELKEI